MSRFICGAVLCLLIVGLAAPMAAQEPEWRGDRQRQQYNPQQYNPSPVPAPDWPEAVMCGESFTVDVTMVNNTRATWTHTGIHKLGPVKGTEDAFRPDGLEFVVPENAQVYPRGRHTFTLELTAPEKKGTYETQWSMMTMGIPYGDPVSGSIRVYCDDAKVARATFPEEVACGETFTAQVRMKNTGMRPWTEVGFYKLGPVMKTDEVFRPDGHKFKMPDFTEVAVDEKYDFEIELTAPDKPGTYETKWTMMDSGKAFGEEIARTINVVCEGESMKGESGGE